MKIPLDTIEPGKFTCQKCVQLMKIGRDPLTESCVLCPELKGSFVSIGKGNSKWCHMICALYTKGMQLSEMNSCAVGLEMIEDRLDLNRCFLCGVDKGITSKCSAPLCNEWMHIPCAISKKCRLVKNSFEIFCPLHSSTPDAKVIETNPSNCKRHS
jgi:hypothetical protein